MRAEPPGRQGTACEAGPGRGFQRGLPLWSDFFDVDGAAKPEFKPHAGTVAGHIEPAPGQLVLPIDRAQEYQPRVTKQPPSTNSRTGIVAPTCSIQHALTPKSFPMFPSGWMALPSCLLRHGNRLSPFHDTILLVGCLLLTLNRSTLRFFNHCRIRMAVAAVRWVASSLFMGIVYL